MKRAPGVISGRFPVPRHLSLNLTPKVKSKVKGQGWSNCPWRLGIFYDHFGANLAIILGVYPVPRPLSFVHDRWMVFVGHGLNPPPPWPPLPTTVICWRTMGRFGTVNCNAVFGMSKYFHLFMTSCCQTIFDLWDIHAAWNTKYRMNLNKKLLRYYNNLFLSFYTHFDSHSSNCLLIIISINPWPWWIPSEPSWNIEERRSARRKKTILLPLYRALPLSYPQPAR